MAAKDTKLDRVESQMLDSYDNDKKVAVLARIQVGAAPSPASALTASVASARHSKWSAVLAACSMLQLVEVGQQPWSFRAALFAASLSCSSN